MGLLKTAVGALGATPLGAITGGIGLASSIYGGIKSAQANREAQEQLDKQFEQNEAFYNTRVNRDFMETNVAKGVVEQLRQSYRDKAKVIDSSAAVTGGTAEASIAAKSKINEAENTALNTLAQKGTSFQAYNEGSYRRSLSDLYRQRMALNQQKQQSASNLAGVGSELMGTAASVAGLEGDTSVEDILLNNNGNAEEG